MQFVERLFRGSCISIMVGAEGTGKSLLVRNVAASVALGKPFLGHATSQRPVLFFELVQSDSNIRHRLKLLNESLRSGTEKQPVVRLFAGKTSKLRQTSWVH